MLGESVVESRYNLELSKQIMTENGWTYSYGTWRKTVNYKYLKTSLNLVVRNSNSGQVSAAEVIKKQLAEAGIAIQIIKANDDQYSKYLTNKNYDMILVGINAPITIDVDSFIGRNNYSNYINDEITNLIKEAKDSRRYK